jgi:hypothetical protein
LCQDVEGAADSFEVAEALELKAFTGRRPWKVQACSAMTGEGLTEGIDWIWKIILPATANDIGPLAKLACCSSGSEVDWA